MKTIVVNAEQHFEIFSTIADTLVQQGHTESQALDTAGEILKILSDVEIITLDPNTTEAELAELAFKLFMEEH